MAEPPQTPSEDPSQPPGAPKPPEKPQIPPNWPQNRRRERTLIRNRRYAALRELIRGGDYFSLAQMRLRAPGLFHHYIGRFQRPQNPPNHPKTPQNHPETLQIHPKILLGDPDMPQNGPKTAQIHPKTSGEPRNLRELLLSALEEGTARADDEDEEEEEEEDEDDEGDEGRVPDAAEQELLRLEFTTRMYQRFLEGQEGDFDYRAVDEDPGLDPLDIAGRDLEERYFDQEEPGPAPPLD